MTGADPALETTRRKAALRQVVLERRRQLPTAALERAGWALADAVLPLVAPGDSVAAYASLGTEPPTGPLLAALSGHRVLLPVLEEDGDLDWAEWEGGLVPGRAGTQQPRGAGLGHDAVSGCALVVVPALAVDRRGTRLGRGGGSYDRALARATGPVVALLHDGELTEEPLPAAPHDVRVAAAATPSDGLVRLQRR